jgi:hypothetical protein
MSTTKELINDQQKLVGAKGRFGHPIKTYDDGLGRLYIHMDSMGVTGVVRAQTWEDAYSICEDEFFPEADETVEELRKEYNFKREHVKIVNDGTGDRPATSADYKNAGKLPDGWFVRWDTVETPCEDENGWTENELFQEAFGFRPNGANVNDTIKHGIYAKDLNGDRLDLLTPELLAELEITLDIQDEE